MPKAQASVGSLGMYMPFGRSREKVDLPVQRIEQVHDGDAIGSLNVLTQMLEFVPRLFELGSEK